MKPSVSAVVPTRDRPELLRLAIDAIRSQEYDGVVEVIVVYDRSEPDMTLESNDELRPVRVIRNTRTPGLAGARNSGTLASTADFVGNCDDDDQWLPGKLAAQIAAFEGAPEAELCGTGVRLVYDGHPTDRVLTDDRVVLAQLIRRRLQELHPSSFLFRRAALLEGIGLVAEESWGECEDYDMLLRAARRGPIVNVPAVYVSALRHPGSYFSTRWTSRIQGSKMILDRYPEFDTDPRGKARITGQIAFAHAALGERRAALRWAGQTIRLSPVEARGYLAMLVAGRLLPPTALHAGLNRYGRGI
ncbi:MAG TPA: glycosyltransferase family A protein [Micromonosporaceae bacterium]|jgi:glycosyltransferase involved in cell wall biosynthesis